MKSIETLKKYMKDRGWTYKGDCNCSGMHTDKFEFKTEAGEYKIKYRYSSFLISTPKEKYKKYKIQELKPIVDELFQKYKATTEA